jgi:hypothetical protein
MLDDSESMGIFRGNTFLNYWFQRQTPWQELMNAFTEFIKIFE